MEFVVNGEVKEITIVDAEGVEYTADIILESTNSGGTVYNKETMEYSMDEKSYLYWSDMSKKLNKISIPNCLRRKGKNTFLLAMATWMMLLQKLLLGSWKSREKKTATLKSKTFFY